MHQILKRLGAIMGTLLLLIVAIPTASSAPDTAADVTDPELVSAELVSDSTVGVGDEVVVEWTVRDESELFAVDFSFAGPHGKSISVSWSGITDTAERDGDLWHGRSVATIESNTDPSGDYVFSGATLIDYPFNTNRIRQAELSLNGFTVDDTAADVTDPELVSAELVSDSTVGVGDEVVVEWTVRDESELFAVDFSFAGPHGKSISVSWSGITDTAERDGDLWHGRSVATIESNTDPSGDYVFSGATLIDYPFNTNRIRQAELSLNGFTVDDTAADVTDPELVSAELVSDSTVGVGDEVVVEWTVRDESELFAVDFSFAGPHGKSISVSWSGITDTAERDGDLWHGRSVATIESNTDPSGDYVFSGATLIDYPFNTNRIRQAELSLNGFTVDNPPISDPTDPVETPEPTDPVETPEPTDPVETPEPTDPVETPEPTDPVETPEPTDPVETPEPTDPVETPEPTDPVETPEPTDPVETPEPTDPVETPEPTDPVETPEPTDPVETPEPTDPVETPEPTDPVETPEPTDPVETPEPTDPVETPEPTDPVETPEPTDPVETPEPTDPVETPEPTDPVETPEPTDLVETPEPTDPVETPEPTDPVETPEPTDPVETPEPTDPVETPEPTDPVETPEPTDPVETPEPTDPVETPEPTDPVETPEPTDPVETPEPTDPVETPEPTDPVENERVSAINNEVEEEQTAGSVEQAATESESGALAQTGASGTLLIALAAISFVGVGVILYRRSRRA